MSTPAPAPALTDERVRMFYACAYGWRTEDSVEDGERDLSEMRARQGAEFDTWLAAHDAAVIDRAKRDERERIGEAIGEARQLRARQVANDLMDRDRGEQFAFKIAARCAHQAGGDHV